MHGELRAFLSLIGGSGGGDDRQQEQVTPHQTLLASQSWWQTTAKIARAYEALDAIFAELQTDQPARATLAELSSRFYMSMGIAGSEDVVDSMLKLGRMVSMLQALYSPTRNVARQEVVVRCTQRDYVAEMYRLLRCELELLTSDSAEFALVRQYVQSSVCCGLSRNRPSIVWVFKVTKPSGERCFRPYRDFTNRQVLWHGSPVENWTGILTKGLLIVPPGVHSSGNCFGKGIYFTNKMRKALKYCRDAVDDRRVLLLSEVALGESVTLNSPTDAKSYVLLVSGGFATSSTYHSCRVTGYCEPDPKGNVVDADGAVWPLGDVVSLDKSVQRETALHHSEFVVYNTSQVRMRYAVVVDGGEL